MNLNLQKQNQTIPLQIGETTITVKTYLPIEDKNDLINLTLQNADEHGFYNLVKVTMYFELYMMYLYTDIEFTDEEKANPAETYDLLMQNGVIHKVIVAIGDEYNTLYGFLSETMEKKNKYRASAAAVINSFIEQLPVNAEAAKDIIKQFNPEDFQQVIQFAQAANGNRPIE